jgi:hypothetical protein
LEYIPQSPSLAEYIPRSPDHAPPPPDFDYDLSTLRDFAKIVEEFVQAQEALNQTATPPRALTPPYPGGQSSSAEEEEEEEDANHHVYELPSYLGESPLPQCAPPRELTPPYPRESPASDMESADHDEYELPLFLVESTSTYDNYIPSSPAPSFAEHIAHTDNECIPEDKGEAKCRQDILDTKLVTLEGPSQVVEWPRELVWAYCVAVKTWCIRNNLSKDTCARIKTAAQVIRKKVNGRRERCRMQISKFERELAMASCINTPAGYAAYFEKAIEKANRKLRLIDDTVASELENARLFAVTNNLPNKQRRRSSSRSRPAEASTSSE